jgi:Pyruvate/2-oxoglutarate dehydrogenase complex, dehydrogenase (E1) component, eukaryotic type, alpha subunit
MYRLSAHGNIIAPPGVPLHFPGARGDREVRRAGGVRGGAQGRPRAGVPRRLVAEGVLTAEDADKLAEQVRDEMQAAVTFGLESPFPEVESSLEYVYA